MNQTNVVFLLPVPVQLDIEWLVPSRKGMRTEQIGSCHWNLGKSATMVTLYQHLEDAVLCQKTLSNVDKSVGETNVAVVVFHRRS